MISNVLNNLDDLSAQDAINILINDFRLSGHQVLFIGTQRLVSLYNLKEEYKDLPCIAAKHVAPLKFLGGPPEMRGYYCGSLLTFLCDQVLLAWYLRDEYCELVEGTPC